jgi:dTMP kinase
VSGVSAAFIVFEGPDGSGKSTQARLLAAKLDARLTREPGGTPVGEQLRGVVLDPANVLDARTEALVIAAARAQHVVDVIAPTLAAGQHVVCDRFWASSIAYQGAGRGLGEERIAELNRWAIDGCLPDLTLLLDVDPDAGRARIARSLDRLEMVDQQFRSNARASFLRQAAADPNWVVIDANQSVDVVEAAVWTAVEPRVRP